MTFISYALNNEDVPLWRALNDVPAGSYVDYGSEPADGPSVTRAFYDQGWSGVSLRPAPGQVTELAALRPRDMVLPDDDPAALAEIIPGCVHFARIDAEDARTCALLDLVLPARPWVVVTRAGSVAGGEVLASAGYHFVLYDGLNRFYLSPDQLARAARLAAPANARDDYVRAGDPALAVRLAAAEASRSIAEARLDGRSQQLLDAVRSVGQARSDLRSMAEASAWLRAQVDDARANEAAHRAEAAWLRQQASSEREARLGQLLARAEEVAWLRECLADSDAQNAAHRAALADMAARAQAAEQRTHAAEASIANSRVLRVARALRGLPPNAPPAPVEPQQVAITEAAPARLPPPQPDANGAAEFEAPPEATAPPIAAPPAHQPARAPATPPPLLALDAPVTTVHQFHAGSAKGDAITNAMLLIRKLLRAQGFHSDIFVQSRGPGLEQDGILLMDALPQHAGIVLLVHHSMGFPGFEAILALPARKVLIYHNITPPALLAAVPQIEQMAVAGRQQLAILRDHVAFALADSDYNAVELLHLSFAPVRTCTLLFDVAAIASHALEPRRDEEVFTALFVGRVTPSKSQHDLIEAFAVFRDRFGKPCRLVLVGALDPEEHRYLERLDDTIKRLGMEADVHLTGLVSDAELRGWYRQAGLYVSLSLHEGFAVPLIEAMAHGVPVLAWPTGAVPYTLGDAGTLLASREPSQVASAMLAAAHGQADTQPGAAAIQRFALDRQMPVLLGALAVAGAVPPPTAATAASLARNVRVTIAARFDAAPGPAAANRSLARTIEAQRPGSVRLLLAPAERASDIPEALPSDLQILAARPDHETGPVLVLAPSHSEPLYVPPLRGGLLVALLSSEASPISAAMAATLDAQFDGVFVASRDAANALADAGVCVPVFDLAMPPSGRGVDPGFTDRLAAATATLLLTPKNPAMRVAWVSSWRVRCGVAEYSRTLLDALPRDRVADLAILADDRTEPGEGTTCAWRIGDDAGNPARLATAIARADADIVMIQHQPGLLPWPVLAAVLDRITAEASRARAVLLTLHNTRHLLTLDEAERPTVVAALQGAARILVHTPADVTLLAGIGLTANVTLLPHPAPVAIADPVPLRALPQDAAPVVGSTGFFLPDKGLQPLIAAVASLRARWPGIRLRLVNAEYDDPLSTAEIAACRQLAESEGLAVEWHTDFVTLEQQAALLTGCDIVVLPYQRSLEASSAAVRNAMSSLVPVAVTPLPLFEEAGDAVFRLPGLDPACLAAGITELLQDADLRQRTRHAAITWLRTHAADAVSRRLHGLMLALATARR